MIPNTQNILLSIILMSFASGILLVGTVFNIYIFRLERRKLYFSIAILGLTGFIFIAADIVSVFFSITDLVSPGMQAHRVEALSTAFYIFALPYFMFYLLDLTPALQKSLKFFYRSGLVIFILIALTAFIKPELFLGLYKPPEALITPWSRGRGTPGAVYHFRDVCIMIVAFYSITMMIIDLIKNKHKKEIFLTLIGTFLALGSGIVDLFYIRQEMRQGLFTLRVFPYFGFGVAIFILLAMVGIMKRYIDQAREIEKARKIESLGVMAGGIAHDFNNILTGILGNATLLNSHDTLDSDLKSFIHEIEKAAKRAKSLSTQLLTFAKGGAPIRKSTSIEKLITETTKFTLRGSNIHVNFLFPDNLWNAHIDKNQISQVIQNIILNAKEAMPSGGNIDIEAANISSHNSPGNNKSADHISIVIRDHGTGIPEKVLGKIFDPYFSTKKSGSGLGLAICWSIIKDHCGELLVESKADKGTTFTIHLPASREKESREERKTEKNIHLEGHVLFMDDEESIRMLVKNILRKIGISCTTTDCGESAVAAFRKAEETGNPFDLVILDLTIPGGMGGDEALTEIRKINNSVKAIITSGYADDAFFNDKRPDGFFDILPKPFSYDSFFEVVRRFLGK
jgi:signal transduction histidine kinase/ActR/RegA family two-component response regulator